MLGRLVGTGDMFDTLHPNDLGHAELAAAFENAIDLDTGMTDKRLILGNVGLIGNFH
jgi:hypothetical protein